MAYERKLPPHPSGRPIRHERMGVTSKWRIPDEEPATPRLRRKQLAHAIGFTAKVCAEDEDQA